MTAPINEAAERLRGMVKAGRGWPTDYLDLLDAALATERRNTVERINRVLHFLDVDASDSESDLPPEPPRPDPDSPHKDGCGWLSGDVCDCGYLEDHEHDDSSE